MALVANFISAVKVGAVALMFCLVLTGLARAGDPPQVLVLGDSLMAANRTLGGSVAQALEKTLGAEVQDRSLSGASYFFGLPLVGGAGMRIGAQYREGAWDYVVMNGGGNDLLFGCGCGKCDRMLDRLVSADGAAGTIPMTVAWLRTKGAKVIYTGYLRTPGVTSPVESCGPLGDELDRRLSLMAARSDGVDFVLLADVVSDEGDRSYHGIDLIHPSVKGSAAIAGRIAKVIKAD